MNQLFALVGCAAIVSLATPALAQTVPVPLAPAIAQTQPNARDVLDACVQNRAELLPNPFVDVSANHWAFKAVLTMYYCGAFRQATPPRLIEQLSNPPAGSREALQGN